MSIESIPYRFRVRRRTASGWTAINEVLLDSEIGRESDTDKFKFGDGVTPWNDLPYVNRGSGSTWIVNSGVPNDADGEDGDLYLNSTSGDVYQKAAGAWGTPVANIEGPEGPEGPPGDTGAAGLSAYQIALANGFVGTEAEWLNSLQGAPGAPGPPGGPTQVLTTSGNLSINYASHNGKYLRHSNGTLTFPEPVAAGFAVGDFVEVRCMAMPVNFAAGAGATLDYDSSRYAPSIFSLRDVVAVKVADATTWDLIGPLADAP